MSEPDRSLPLVAVRGVPDDGELAALIAVLGSLGSRSAASVRPRTPATRSTWHDPRRGLDRLRRFRAAQSRWDVPAVR